MPLKYKLTEDNITKSNLTNPYQNWKLDTGFIDTFNNQIWAFIALKKLRLVKKLQKGRNGNMNGA